MRSSMRCKEHFQGDRCSKAKMHDYATNPGQDLIHAGNWSAWTGSGDSKELKGELVGRRIMFHRVRMNKVLRKAEGLSMMADKLQKKEFRDMAKQYLSKVASFLRGRG